MRVSYHKTIFRVDYRPSLRFYDKLHSLAASIEGYPDWWTQGLFLALQNYDHHCSLQLGHTNWVYTQDMKGKGEEDDKRIRRAIELIGSIPREGEFKRVALRRMYLHPASMSFADLVSLVDEKFLAHNAQIKEGICPNPVDVSYVVIFREAAATVKLSTGPMRRDELEVHLQPDRNNNFPPRERSIPASDLYSDYAEVSLFADIDYFKEDVKETELLSVYELALSFHEKLAQNVINYVFGL